MKRFQNFKKRESAALLTLAAQSCNIDMIGEGELGSAPSLSMANQYSVQRPWEAEGIRQRLYDFQLYPTAGATQFRFFQNPKGQGLSTSPGNAGNPKTDADTNMTQAGTLPSPQMFLCTSVEVRFTPGSVATASTFTPQVLHSFVAVPTNAVPISGGAVNDVNAVVPYGFLNFTIMSKSYLTETGLISFPPKTALALDGYGSSNSATTGAVESAYCQATGRPYYMNPPVLLMPTANFEITINFPVVIATPSGFNARLGVVLDGFLYRNSQ